MRLAFTFALCLSTLPLCAQSSVLYGWGIGGYSVAGYGGVGQGGYSQGSTATGKFTIGGTASGPPSYRGTIRNVITTCPLPATMPFVGLVGANTVNTTPEPAGCFNTNPWLRVTDSLTRSAAFSFSANQAGSGDENGFSMPGCPSGLYLFGQDNGTFPYVFTLTPGLTPFLSSSLKYGGSPNTLKIFGGGTFSYTRCAIFYSAENPAQTNIGTQINSSDFSSATVPALVPVFDYASSANCLQPQGTAPTWNAGVSVSKDDQTFLNAYSYTGPQNTGIYVVAWNRTKGCTKYNTSTGQVTSDPGWGPGGNGYICGTPPCTVNIYTLHNTKIGKAGDWAVIEPWRCELGATCNYASDSVGWLIGTATLQPFHFNSLCASGHWTEGYTHWINSSNSPEGQYCSRLFSTPSTAIGLISIFPPGLLPPLDSHCGWSNVDTADSFPFLCTTTTDANPPNYASPWENEGLLIFPNGDVARAFHTYANVSATFPALEGIGSFSQDGKYFALSSSMNNGLGSTGGLTTCVAGATGTCRGDLFVIQIN